MQELIKLIPTGTFADYLLEIKQHRPKLFTYEQAWQLPWGEYQQALIEDIVKAIDRLEEAETAELNQAIPATGLAGIYFCIGDDGRSFTIGGSLYFNEDDWAANADFYPNCREADNLMFEITSEIVDNLDVKPWKIDGCSISQLMYVFSAFTVFHAMYQIENKPALMNCGMAIGYSDGGELTLGQFKNGKFEAGLKIIEEVW
ncbi:MAG: hypothetical protein GKR77_02075 [Legionellales bacterium]|nr:hypothetical protein [Legionellales bacterium]